MYRQLTEGELTAWHGAKLAEQKATAERESISKIRARVRLAAAGGRRAFRAVFVNLAGQPTSVKSDVRPVFVNLAGQPTSVKSDVRPAWRREMDEKLERDRLAARERNVEADTRAMHRRAARAEAKASR